jgi:hypothetical protein
MQIIYRHYMCAYPRKATDEQIINAYRTTASCKAVGKMFGMCAQSIHERLIKMNASNPVRKWTDSEIQTVSQVYASGIIRGDGKLKLLSESIGRTVPFISRKASELGLTSYNRSMTKENAKKISVRSVEWYKSNEHPKGFKNHHHTENAKNKISMSSLNKWKSMNEVEKSEHTLKALKARLSKSGVKPRSGCTWKAGWRTIGGVEKYYRSRWEANYARYLEWLKQRGNIQSWEHEPETFWFESIKRGCRSYLPDFKVIEKNGETVYHEVKGWMDARSKTKIKRMAKYHPLVKLTVIDSKRYAKLEKQVAGLIPTWEQSTRRTG